MKRNIKTMLGVTLLEIMLVLAIAAMVIVMSIRYYQAALLSQQITAVMETVQAISAAMDNLAQGTGSYSNISGSQVSAVLGGGNATKTPWLTDITVVSAGGTKYTVKITAAPASVCNALMTKIPNISKRYSNASTSCGAAKTDYQYTYDSSTPNS